MAYSKYHMALRYGTVFALGAFVLQWLEYQLATQLYSPNLLVLLLACLFTGLGIWIGSRRTLPAPSLQFTTNTRAIAALGLTRRELDVLELLALGHSNREIADSLFVTNSTIKTHLVHLYQKLEVQRRTQAIDKERSLHIIP